MKAGGHANVAFFIPYAGCKHRCSFCDQRAVSGEADAPSPKTVEETLSRAAREMGDSTKNAEIAFFGGSFTALPADIMTAYLGAARPFVGDGGFSGIRVSTRPDAVDEPVLRLLKSYRVTAVELGAQSMAAEVLRKNGRGHTPEDTARASRLVRGYGFSLGLQMMTGLYGDSDAGALYTARELISLKPDTVRIYPAVVLKNTGLERLYKTGEYVPQTLDAAVALCAGLILLFRGADVRVIRTGLHAVDPDAFAAGPFHPAFAELCFNKIYLDKAAAMLKLKGIGPGPATVFAAPRAVSRMVGQNRRNIEALRALGYDVKVVPDGRLEEFELSIT